MTLIIETDLDSVKANQHAKLSGSFRSKVIVRIYRQTDTHTTDRLFYMDYKVVGKRFQVFNTAPLFDVQGDSGCIRISVRKPWLSRWGGSVSISV